jgi:hypothetical protein
MAKERDLMSATGAENVKDLLMMIFVNFFRQHRHGAGGDEIWGDRFNFSEEVFEESRVVTFTCRQCGASESRDIADEHINQVWNASPDPA